MPETAPLSELLIGAPLFQDLPEKDLLKALNGKLAECTFETGQELIPRGKLPEALFLIREGTARLLGAAEDPVSLELLKPGSVVGWFSLANHLTCEWVRASASLKALRIRLTFLKSSSGIIRIGLPPCVRGLRFPNSSH